MIQPACLPTAETGLPGRECRSAQRATARRPDDPKTHLFPPDPLARAPRQQAGPAASAMAPRSPLPTAPSGEPALRPPQGASVEACVMATDDISAARQERVARVLARKAASDSAALPASAATRPDAPPGRPGTLKRLRSTTVGLKTSRTNAAAAATPVVEDLPPAAPVGVDSQPFLLKRRQRLEGPQARVQPAGARWLEVGYRYRDADAYRRRVAAPQGTSSTVAVDPKA